MAFAQQHRPRTSRQLHAPEPAAAVATSSQQLKRRLEESEEWVLFSPTAPSTAARTHTTSTERTPRTAGVSRFSEFGSLDTAARSDQDDDNGTFLGTEEELDSLDDGLHAFHEPSEHALSTSRLQESGDTVLPNHDGLGSFQPDATMQEHMWQFERSSRRRAARRRSSVQRHFTILDDTDEVTEEQERRQRIERWRLEQSKAVLEEIERETRRRRRMSMAASTRSQRETARQDTTSSVSSIARTVTSEQSEGSDEGTENMSFWQRLTTRVIRDLIGLDNDTLSVIFGESLPEEAMTPKGASPTISPADRVLQDAVADVSAYPEEDWQTRVLERVAQELGVLVHQLSEHPGAFSTYQRAQTTPEYAGLSPNVATNLASSGPTSSQPFTPSPASVQFAATFPTQQTSHTYSEASLWGIEEEPDEIDAMDTSHPDPAAAARAATEDAAREREYWERDLDVKMIFNFLVKRFTSRRSSTPTPTRRVSASTCATDEGTSARRAAMIRQNHPLVSRTTERGLPTSSSGQSREAKRRESGTMYRTHYNPQAGLRQKTLRSSSSCASQSTKKSKRSGSSQRNYWDLGGSVGSGSVLAGEV
ncbi:hypothetical protein BU25DRAFT_345400 [Macroventuria anomochaeta]|uniref:Uncharacterized protein n=1 Tax=Macroventuria anomochaeta TaxID=301207 RepID=A0ACB6RXQ7_9PLEO|nr:uncharacterized protein BU25DRAFT_345400 [Macroventuria anomochaeta]KAF2625719.1 hypothetical protein BU25DRAFT_345400 [Macroventuria anomochaeta]